MKYNSYKHYLRVNKIKDSKEAYREYLELTSSVFRMMGEKMKENHVKVTYVYRFAIQP